MPEKSLIILAEDELLIATVLKKQLESKGFEVKHVVDADPLYKLLEDHQPVALILDCQLKNSNGIEAVRKIRASHREMPVIITTGNAMQQAEDEVKQISNCKVLIKPVLFGAILETLSNFGVNS
ncbi:MAG: response regulator [Crocinitomicaceae bacterium]|nr:response regulator [Crocinitomicaceae bacterium]MBK8927659.1 response regulator [Crocinitomicaceae bacterium]